MVTIFYFEKNADMAGRSLLNPLIDSKHRAAVLEESPGILYPLVTRVANANWQLHPDWLDRYNILPACGNIYGLSKMCCYVQMQVEVGWAFTFRASG